MAEQTAQKKKGGTGRKIVLLLVLIVAIGVFVYSGIQLLGITNEYSEGDAVYSEMREFMSDTVDPGPQATISNVAPNATSVTSGSNTAGTGGIAPAAQYSVPDFKQLQAVNSDCVAWLRVYDTKIDYPVAQAQDNDYYLTHTFKRTANSAGCLFLDYQNQPDFSDKNSVIYGHNMKSGSMFNNLTKFKDKAFFDAHRNIKLFLPGKDGIPQEVNLLVFSAYVASPNQNFNRIGFSSDQDFLEYVQVLMGRSDVQIDEQFDADDRIVTLSTCSYEFEDARYVLHAKVLS